MANSPGDWLVSPWAQLLMTAIGGRQQRQAQRQYERAVENRYGQGMADYQERIDRAMQMADRDPDAINAMNQLWRLRNRTLPQARTELAETTGRYDAARRGVLSRMGQAGQGYLNRYDQSTGGILDELAGADANTAAGYGKRETDVMGLLEGLGASEREEINEQFDEEARAQQGFVNERGWGNSGLSTGAASNVARKRRQALGSADERLRGQKAGFLSNLRGDALSFGERSAGNRAGLRSGFAGNRLSADQALENARSAYDAAITSDSLGARERALNNLFSLDTGLTGNIANFQNQRAGNKLNTYLQTTGDRLGFLERRNDVPPDQNQWLALANQFGQNAVEQPKPPSPWYSFGGSAAGGIGSGVGTALAFGLLSDKRLKDVITQIGDAEADAILRKLEALPVSRWKYKEGTALDQFEHIGPMAQDFGEAFTDRPDARTINPLDAQGVLFAAVKALAARVRDLEARRAA